MSGVRTHDASPSSPLMSIGVYVSHVGMDINAGVRAIRVLSVPVPAILDRRNASLVSSAIST